jgi:hypothetical protein
VDTPPGTSDEHISIVQYLSKALGPNDGAVIVSTPQEARADTHTQIDIGLRHRRRAHTPGPVPREVEACRLRPVRRGTRGLGSGPRRGRP